MERLLENCEHNHTEEPCKECTPTTEREEKIDTTDYDYHKRLWF